jgi:hypothetical protein
MKETSGDFDQISAARAVSASSIDLAYFAMMPRMASASDSAYPATASDPSALASASRPDPATATRAANAAAASRPAPNADPTRILSIIFRLHR